MSDKHEQYVDLALDILKDEINCFETFQKEVLEAIQRCFDYEELQEEILAASFRCSDKRQELHDQDFRTQLNEEKFDG